MRSGEICPGVRKNVGTVRLVLVDLVAVSYAMKLFTVARSATMMSRAASASILSCAAAAVVASVAAVATIIYSRRAVSLYGSILRNVALVITILTLVDEVLLFWICKLSGGSLAWLL